MRQTHERITGHGAEPRGNKWRYSTSEMRLSLRSMELYFTNKSLTGMGRTASVDGVLETRRLAAAGQRHAVKLDQYRPSKFKGF